MKAAADSPKNNPFQIFALSEPLQKALADFNFRSLTAVQEKSLPLTLAGKDVIAQAQTGSGKTAAFLIPVLQKINLTKAKTQALILCPTRELADQVYKESLKFSKYLSQLKTISLLGGHPFETQAEQLSRGAHLIIGTPGRTLEHLKSGKWSVSELQTFVLDEADRLLEAGFAQELEAILNLLPMKRQNLFFSATFPESILKLSHLTQTDPQRVLLFEVPTERPKIEQFLYLAEKPHKLEVLLQILQCHPFHCALIFCRTKMAVDQIGKALAQLNARSATLHADLPQAERDQTARLFRNGSLKVLVATDVAARGLDIETLDLVINFDLPPTVDIYIHRVGRTGRAGRKGAAIALATDYEAPLVLEIEKAIQAPLTRPDLQEAPAVLERIDFQETSTRTLQVSAGRSQKIRSEDWIQLLTSGSQSILVNDIGRIEILDRLSFVAVVSTQAERALHKIRNSKWKGEPLQVKIF